MTQQYDDWDKEYEREQLHFAAGRGDLSRCRDLVAAGYDPNRFDTLGNTPLRYAAQDEHLEVVRLLLSLGANVNALDQSKIGCTPLSHVAQTCSVEMAKTLLAAGADPTIRCGLSRSAIKKAKERKRGDGPRVYELLCQHASGNF